MQLTHDPSLSSYYVTDAFYRRLVANFSDWQSADLLISDPAERDRFRLLLETEARLLDQLRFDEWLAMYAPECVYWAPGTPECRVLFAGACGGCGMPATLPSVIK